MPVTRARIAKMVSGGQTGVDRAALDAAIACRVPHGGWCPKGRLAEDGPIPRRYRLRQMPTPSYSERTRANVHDSDATLIIASGPLTGGTLLTAQIAAELKKPLLLIDLAAEPNPIPRIRRWLVRVAKAKPIVLNVAGPRASQRNLYAPARALLEALLGGPDARARI